MKTIRIQLIEDDLIIGENLMDDLFRLGYQDVVFCRNSEEAIREFKKLTPDLILMDIELKGSSLNGVELAEFFIRKADVSLVYISGKFGPGIIKSAKSTNPKAFLVKPYNLNQLRVTLELSIDSMSEATKGFPLLNNQSMGHLTENNLLKEFFFVKNGTKHIKIDIHDIIYVKAESPGNNVQIFNKSGKVFFSVGMKSFINQVQHKNLIRVNRSYLINISALKSFNRACVFLEHNGANYEIPIGKVYRDSLMSNIKTLKSD